MKEMKAPTRHRPNINIINANKKNIVYKILNYVLCELIQGPRSGREGAEGPLINASWKSILAAKRPLSPPVVAK